MNENKLWVALESYSLIMLGYENERWDSLHVDERWHL